MSMCNDPWRVGSLGLWQQKCIWHHHSYGELIEPWIVGRSGLEHQQFVIPSHMKFLKLFKKKIVDWPSLNIKIVNNVTHYFTFTFNTFLSNQAIFYPFWFMMSSEKLKFYNSFTYKLKHLVVAGFSKKILGRS